jgi:hypothetical protein
MKTAMIHLHGPQMRGTRVSVALLRKVLGVLLEGSKRAVRLRLEGRSTASGPAPAWLEAASALDLVGIADGSTQLTLEAPTLLKAVPQQFRQVEMFGSVDPDSTCFDLLGDALDDALAGRDSENYDDCLLDTLQQLQGLSDHGVVAVDFVARRRVTIDEQRIEQLAVLKRSIPAGQRTILAGKLDAIRHSDRMFTLNVQQVGAVRGLFTEAVSSDVVGLFWGKDVRVGGLAKFRPSGGVLRIEAETIEPASDADIAVWSSLPRPISSDLDVRALRKPQTSRSGVASIFGQWPGDESDEEFERALADLS